MRNVVSYLTLVLMWAAVFGALALVAMGHPIFGMLMVVVVTALGACV